MKISAVISLYNKKQYIRRSIESMLNQKMPPDEIIVVDDGSIDGSAEEVLKLADSRIRLIQQPNAGEGAARNRGVAEAHNDLVAFLDADDEWKPDFLLYIQKLYKNFPGCGAYATAYEIIEPDGSNLYPLLKGIPSSSWMGIIPNLFRMMQYGSPFFPSSVMMPKGVYQDLKGFPEGITQGADKMMWICLGVKYSIAFSSSRLVVYHRDALNRASNAFERESAAANLIDGILKNQEVPLELLEDIKDYNAYLKIQKARHRVKAGYGKLARDLLSSIKQNRKYRYQFLWWYFLSIIPYSLIKHLSRREEHVV